MADNNTFITVPPDIATNHIALKRFLQTLVEQLDVAFGNRGTDPFAKSSLVTTNQNTLTNLLKLYLTVLDAEDVYLSKVDAASEYLTKVSAATIYLKIDGSTAATGILSYNNTKIFSNPLELISKDYVDSNFTDNPKQTDPGDLGLTAGATYTQSELQAVADKVDAVLATLRLANIY